MLTLDIDTRLPGEIGLTTFVPDWFLDLCPDPQDERAVGKAYAQHLIGHMSQPVKIETVRRHLVGAWPFLRELSTIDPASFDAVFTEYAARRFEADCASASGGTGQ